MGDISIAPATLMHNKSPYRRIVTDLPVPESLAFLEECQSLEPRVRRQMPVVWHRAEGVQVFDEYGNMWLDWTSGIVTTNAGHGDSSVIEALHEQAATGVLHAYRFPTRLKLEFLQTLTMLTGFETPILLSTGGEAVEMAIRIVLEHGHSSGKDVIVSFDNSFHGSTALTLGAGGQPCDPQLVPLDFSRFIRVPYPDSRQQPRQTLASFVDSLRSQVDVQRVAAVIFEPYLSATLAIADGSFMRDLRRWCTKHGVYLIADEVQSGFGRTGRLLASAHFDIRPDLVCVAKGLSGSLPLSAVLCATADMLRVGKSSLYTTHSGNPLALAAGLANLRLFADGVLVKHADVTGEVLQRGLVELAARHPRHIASVSGIGMVGCMRIRSSGRSDADMAHAIVEAAWRQGLLLLAPIAVDEVLIKICPPLISTTDHIHDGLAVLDEVLKDM